MANKRTKGVWGATSAKNEKRKAENAARMRRERGSMTAADQSARVSVAEARKIVKEMVRCQNDFLYFYDKVLSTSVRDRKTKELKKQRLGAIHRLMIDFASLDIINDVKTHSALVKYLPERNEHGDFKERWLYWKTLDGEPESQDGPVGDISDAFYSKLCQGVVIRICGDGLTKCLLAPRGHLKSTICGQYHTLWRVIRDPSERHVIKCAGSKLAKLFLGVIKKQFESNDKFKALFGHLQPDKREAAWNTEQIQVKWGEVRGKEPTIDTMGVESESVGCHGDDYLFDDVVGKANSTTPDQRAKTRLDVQAMEAQREPDALLLNIGTRWANDDAHVMFVGKPGEADSDSGCLSQDTCFFQATVLDADETVKVKTNISPLGYGKPIWGEHWTMRMVERKRRGMPDDFLYFCQYFNYPMAGDHHLFKSPWIQRFPDRFKGVATPKMAEELKLNIFQACDTASGKEKQAGKLDRTANLVWGQTPDRKAAYFLDGFCEKLPAESIAPAMVNMAMKWHGIARGYGGHFKAGFEKTVYTNFLSILLREEQKKHGESGLFTFDLLDHKGQPKIDRITPLVDKYFNGYYFWPEKLMVPGVPILDRDGKEISRAEPYDLCAVLEHEWINYTANATLDDCLDAHAYIDKILYETDWKDERKPKDISVRERGQDTPRGEYAVTHEILDTYAVDGSWELAL